MRHPAHLRGQDFGLLNGQVDYSPMKNIIDSMPMNRDTITGYIQVYRAGIIIDTVAVSDIILSASAISGAATLFHEKDIIIYCNDCIIDNGSTGKERFFTGQWVNLQHVQQRHQQIIENPGFCRRCRGRYQDLYISHII